MYCVREEEERDEDVKCPWRRSKRGKKAFKPSDMNDVSTILVVFARTLYPFYRPIRDLGKQKMTSGTAFLFNILFCAAPNNCFLALASFF